MNPASLPSDGRHAARVSSDAGDSCDLGDRAGGAIQVSSLDTLEGDLESVVVDDDEAEMADETKAVASNGSEAGHEACCETSAAAGEDGCVGVGGTSGSGGPAGCTSCRR